MAIYKVQDPSGNIREMEGPDAATDEQVLNQAKSLFSGNTQAIPTIPDTPEQVSQKLAKAKQGLADVDNMQIDKPNQSIGDSLGINPTQNTDLYKTPFVGAGLAAKDALLSIKPKETLQQASSGPIMGAVQMAADATGNTNVSNAIAKNTSEGGFGLGSFMQPEGLLTGSAMGKFIGQGGNALMKAIRGSTAGGLYGGYSTVGEGGSRGGQTVAGTAFGGLVGPVVQGITKGSQFLADAVRGRSGLVSAGKLARNVAGDKLDDIVRLNASAPDNITSSQAAVGADRSVYNALGELARSKDANDVYSGIAKSQAKNRVGMLEAVKPDLKIAEATRKATANPLYDSVRNNQVPIDASPIVSKINKLLDDNSGNPEFVTALNKVKGGFFDETGKPVTSAIKISSIMDGLKKALGDKDNKFIRGELTQIREEIANVLPNRVAADKAFAKASAPVNQSKVIDAMLEKMEGVTGGEVQRPLLNAIGKGENALLKKANQDPRFGNIDEILTPKQKAAKNTVESEFLRDFDVQERAKESIGAFADIVKKNQATFQIPNFLNPKITTANAALSVLENKINDKTMKEIVKGMANGKSANKMLQALPSGERNKIVKALAEQRATPYAFGAATSMQHKENK